MLRSEECLPASVGALAPHSQGGPRGFPGQSETAGEDAEATASGPYCPPTKITPAVQHTSCLMAFSFLK